MGRYQTSTVRASVWLDKYAPFDVGREYQLGDRERWLLLSLCLAADWRDHRLQVTLSELSEWTGTSRTTVPKVLKRLAHVGLIAIISPFGPNRAGKVEILAWDRLIVPNNRRRPHAKDGAARPDRNLVEEQPATSREAIATDVTNDKGEQMIRRQQVREDVRNGEHDGAEANLVINQNRAESANLQPIQRPVLPLPPNRPALGYYLRKAEREADSASSVQQ